LRAQLTGGVRWHLWTPGAEHGRCAVASVDAERTSQAGCVGISECRAHLTGCGGICGCREQLTGGVRWHLWMPSAAHRRGAVASVVAGRNSQSRWRLWRPGATHRRCAVAAVDSGRRSRGAAASVDSGRSSQAGCGGICRCRAQITGGVRWHLWIPGAAHRRGVWASRSPLWLSEWRQRCQILPRTAARGCTLRLCTVTRWSGRGTGHAAAGHTGVNGVSCRCGGSGGMGSDRGWSAVCGRVAQS